MLASVLSFSLEYWLVHKSVTDKKCELLTSLSVFFILEWLSHVACPIIFVYY